jgi:hypothetical protein
VQEKYEKYAKKTSKMRKRAKCKCDAKMESKFASHRTTVTKKIAFSHFLHRIRIALPSLVDWSCNR